MSKKHPLWGTDVRDDAPRDARSDDTRDNRSRSANRNRQDGPPTGRTDKREGKREDGRGDAPRGHAGKPGERRDSRPGGSRDDRNGRPERPGHPPHRGKPADGRRDARSDARPGARPESRHDVRDILPDVPESPCSILPGVKPVLELLESDPSRVETVLIRKGKRGREVDRIVELCREARVRFIFAEAHALDRLFASGKAIAQSASSMAEPDTTEPDMVGNQAADDLFADDDEAWDILEGRGAARATDDAATDAATDDNHAARTGRAPQASHSSHQGVIARVFDAGFAEFGDILRDAPDAPLPLIVALDQVQDPGNVGTLARTLYALGAAGLVVVRHGGAALGGAAARAAAGALEKLPVAKVTNLARALDEADEAGYTIYAAGGAAPDADGKPGSGPRNPFTEPLRTPAVLVLGNEDSGIRPNVAKRCHFTLSIPMARDFDSLNVAQAGAILVGCFAARRHKG
ncbi:RNA methyltransferase [Cupidesulfovibrio termitidis]|uniref:TrmH family RNA methyltransferase n=1 Tax=Nitratidesulfovibrio termitidis TaxID=42252 RepID=UPI0004252768